MSKTIKQCIEDMNCASDPSYKNGNDYYCVEGKDWCSQEEKCKTMLNSGYPFFYLDMEEGKPYRTVADNKLVVHKPDDPIIEHRESRNKDDPARIDPRSGDCWAFELWNRDRNCPNCPMGYGYSPDKIKELNEMLENAITCDYVMNQTQGHVPEGSVEVRLPWPSPTEYCVNPKKAPLIPTNCWLYQHHPLCYIDPDKGAIDSNIGKCSIVPDALLPPHAGPHIPDLACLPDLSHCDCSNEECVKKYPFIFNEKACLPGPRPRPRPPPPPPPPPPSNKCSREVCAKDQCDNNNPYLCLDGPAKGGCSSTPWTGNPNCSLSCNTVFCRHQDEKGNCSRDVCGWQTCSPSNPHLCLDGPAKGGCSATNWESIPDCYASCNTSNC